MNQVLVEPDGLASSPESDDLDKRSERRRVLVLQWLAAAIIGTMAAGTLALVGDGSGALSPISYEHLIQAHLDAWYGGDYDTALSLQALPRVRTGPSEDVARAEVEYQAILEARTDLLGCEELPPSTVRCDVAYSNALNDAVEAAPAVVAQQFGIQDGLVLFVAGPYLEDKDLTNSFASFATEMFPIDYEESCREEPNYQSPTCADFKLLRLDEWTVWHGSDRSGVGVLGLDDAN